MFMQTINICYRIHLDLCVIYSTKFLMPIASGLKTITLVIYTLFWTGVNLFIYIFL